MTSPEQDGASHGMKVSQLYVYPIKSLRGIKTSKAQLTKYGFPYDRSFMLLHDKGDKVEERYKNMFLADHPEMALFSTNIKFPDHNFKGEITVTYTPPDDEARTLTVPLQPDTADLASMDITMHDSPTTGYNMGDHYNSWFSNCFGYPVAFVYIGSNTRAVLFPEANGRQQPPSSWLTNITSTVSSIIGREMKSQEERIAFHDCASYLVVNQKSCDAVSAWLPEGENMDIVKFRPNIVLSSTPSAWDEDYWGEITVSTSEGNQVKISLLHNCIRCQTLNIDYSTGKLGTGKTGEVLKMLQKDRRVDKGKKYGAVFGRYGFLQGEGGMVSIGDEVRVSKRNGERTAFGRWLIHP